MTTNCLIWLDRTCARIVVLRDDQSSRLTIQAEPAPAGRLDHRFVADVARAVEEAEALVLAGPGAMARDLYTYLSMDRPDLAERVIGVEQMAETTDTMLRMYTRTYFRTYRRTGEHRTLPS